MRTTSQEAIQHHYDAGNDFYALWLDERAIQLLRIAFRRR